MKSILPHKTEHVTHKAGPIHTTPPVVDDTRARLIALERKVEELAKRETPPAQVILKGNS